MDRAALLRGVTRGCVVAAGVLTALVVVVAVRFRPSLLTVSLAVIAVLFVAVPVVGAAIVRAGPRNPVGWLLLAAGVSLPLAVGAFVYARTAVPEGLTGAAWAGWLDGWPWVPAVALVPTVGLLLFPDGAVPSARWRPVLWAGIAVAVALEVSLLFGSTLLDFADPPNPTALPGTAGEVAGGLGVTIALVAPLSTISAVAVQRRFRAARGSEIGQALGLVAPAAWLMAASWWSCIVVVAATGESVDAIFGEAVGMLTLAVTAWLAIRRYGLFDTRTVLNRALVYGALTGCVVAVYLVVASVVGVVAGSAGDPVGVVVAVLVALPLRDRLQRLANRVVFGYRDDPYEALVRLGQRLEDAAASGDVLPSVARVVREALRLPYVAIEIGGDVVAEAGHPLGERRAAFPLVFAGETVGTLAVEPHDEREPGEAGRRLLTGIAGQVAVAVHAVSLTSDLLRSRERLVAATEEERRRLRRDLHDGLGPGLAGLVLGLQRARTRIPVDPDAAVAQLDQLTGQAQSAVAEVRRLVHGLRPPALDELGLLGALDEQARSLGATVTGSVEAELSAAVEVAAYRIALEAMTNAARHAGARRCDVRLSARPGGAVEVAVDDDGVGLPPAYRAGVGITSMRERATELGGRLTVERRLPAGTSVRATIPLEAR